MEINHSIINPETFFHSNHPKVKHKSQTSTLTPTHKTTHQMRKPSNTHRSYSTKKHIAEDITYLMQQKVDPIHSQKSHNVLQLLKSLNKITPRKYDQKIKFKS